MVRGSVDGRNSQASLTSFSLICIHRSPLQMSTLTADRMLAKVSDKLLAVQLVQHTHKLPVQDTRDVIQVVLRTGNGSESYACGACIEGIILWSCLLQGAA